MHQHHEAAQRGEPPDDEVSSRMTDLALDERESVIWLEGFAFGRGIGTDEGYRQALDEAA